MSLFHVTDEDFEEKVIGSQKTVIVDFFANWCGPCRMLSPVLEEIAEEREDVDIAKVDVDECPELAQRYGIVSIPALMVIRGGECVASSVGYMPKDDVEKLLDK